MCAWAWIRVAGISLLLHSNCSVYLPGIIRVRGPPSIPPCLSYASTVLPVCDSETGDGTAMCAYPAGIDLATGEGVFVSPHFADMSLISGRWVVVVVGTLPRGFLLWRNFKCLQLLAGPIQQSARVSPRLQPRRLHHDPSDGLP